MKPTDALDQAMLRLYEISGFLDMGFAKDTAFLDEWEEVLDSAQRLIEDKRKALVPAKR